MTTAAILFLMVGLPGSGKTTKALELEKKYQALRLTPDDWMIPLFGASVPEKRDILEGRFVWLARNALAAGTSTILDFGLWGRDERTALRAMASAVGADAAIVHMGIDEDLRQQRISERYTLEPGQTFHMTAVEIAEHQDLFQTPDDQELAHGPLDRPPKGYSSWVSWASERWPTSSPG